MSLQQTTHCVLTAQMTLCYIPPPIVTVAMPFPLKHRTYAVFNDKILKSVVLFETMGIRFHTEGSKSKRDLISNHRFCWLKWQLLLLKKKIWKATPRLDLSFIVHTEFSNIKWQVSLSKEKDFAKHNTMWITMFGWCCWRVNLPIKRRILPWTLI